MTQDVYLGRPAANAGNVSAFEASDPDRKEGGEGLTDIRPLIRPPEGPPPRPGLGGGCS